MPHKQHSLKLKHKQKNHVTRIIRSKERIAAVEILCLRRQYTGPRLHHVTNENTRARECHTKHYCKKKNGTLQLIWCVMWMNGDRQA